MRKRILEVSGGLAVLASLSTPIAAQEGRVLEEVIVTATKSAQTANVQSVPIAMTAFNDDQLQRMNFTDLESLTAQMPNAAFDDVGTIPGYANFSFRGVGISSSIPSVDPAVGVFVDGVYLGTNAGILFDNFDLEGLEVLRGPQGILFGRNVTGGAVILRTTTPTDELTVRGRYSVETGLKHTGNILVSGPLADGISGKIAAYYSKDTGYFENYDGQDAGESDMWIVRPALRFQPRDDLDIQLRLEHGESDGHGSLMQNWATSSRNSHDLTLNYLGYNKLEWDQAILQADWDIDFGNGVVTAIAGWRDVENLAAFDTDGTTNTAFHVGESIIAQDQVSLELRYAGQLGDFSVTTGVFYYEQDVLYIEERLMPGSIAGGGDQTSSSWAAFAAADWQISPNWVINFGARYTYEEKEARVAQYNGPLEGGPLGCDPATGSCNFTFHDKGDWSDVSPRIGFQWTPRDDRQLYGYWARGFRAGGYNLRQVAPQDSPGPYDPEQVDTVEFGLKSDFLDRSVRTNVAVFYTEMDDMIREASTPHLTLGHGISMVNAGKSEFKGIEFEGQWLVSDSVSASLFFGYTDHKYTKVLADLNRDGVIDNIDKGLTVPRLSPWTYGFSLEHIGVIGDWGNLLTRVSYSHRDSYYSDDRNDIELNDSDKFGINITLEPFGSNFSFSLYADNLTDEVTHGAAGAFPDIPPFGGGVGGPTPTFAPLNKGRVVGASVQYRM